MNASDLLGTDRPSTKPYFPALVSPVWVVVVAGVLSVLPVFFYGIPSNIDLLNHFRFALPFYEAIQQGTLHPSWLAESNFGYGDTSFRFYPPALYYLLAIARALTRNWYVATTLVLLLLSVLGSVGVYIWAREFLPPSVAMCAGVFYSFAPYHLNQLYQAFLLAEFAAASILPFAFAFVVRVCRRGELRDVAALAVSLAVLILTHLPMTVIGAIAIALYAFTCIEKQNWWSNVRGLVTAVLLALSASAFYWTTMVAELKWIRAYDSESAEFRHNFLLTTFSPNNLNVWWMNILLLATILMFWPLFVMLKQWKAQQRHLISCIVLVLFSTVMTLPLSRPLWEVLGPLKQVQFPWRWLGITSMAASVALAAALPYWRNVAIGRQRFLSLIAGGTFLVALTFSVSHTIREARFFDANEFEATLRSIPGTQGVWQWWPIWVRSPIRIMEREVETGPRTLSVESWTPEKRVFQVSAGEPREVRVRTFYYPFWTATTNGTSLKTSPDKDGGLLVSIPGDRVSIILEFKEPPRVGAAVFFSLIGWISIASLAVSRSQKRSYETIQVG